MEKMGMTNGISETCEKLDTPEPNVSELRRINNFVHELERTLRQQLRTRVGCFPSRRIEDQFSWRPVMMPFNQIIIIVDADIDTANYKLIVAGLCKFIRKDRYYRTTRYNIVHWTENGFSLMMTKKLTALQLEQNLADLVVENDSNTDWTTYRNLYTQYQREHKVILITTQHKVDDLKLEKKGIAKNLMILYPSTSPKKRAYSSHGMTYLGFPING